MYQLTNFIGHDTKDISQIRQDTCPVMKYKCQFRKSSYHFSKLLYILKRQPWKSHGKFAHWYVSLYEGTKSSNPYRNVPHSKIFAINSKYMHGGTKSLYHFPNLSIQLGPIARELMYQLYNTCTNFKHHCASWSKNPPPSVRKLVAVIYFNCSVGKCPSCPPTHLPGVYNSNIYNRKRGPWDPVSILKEIFILYTPFQVSWMPIHNF